MAVLGAALLTVRSMIGAGTVWLLPVSLQARMVGAVDFAVTGVLAAVTLLLPWPRLPRVALLMYPVLGLLGLAILGSATTGIGPVYVGFLVFVFLYVGCTGATRAVLALLPAGAGAWLLLNGVTHTGVPAALGVRLAISVSVWAAVGLLLARRSSAEHAHRVALTDAAHTDPLTGLDNRRVLDEALAGLRPGDAVIAVDLDEFREINTARGHSGGDTVLAEFGRTVRVGLRAGDRAIRQGGDEFVLVLTGVSDVQVLSVLTRVREQWRHQCGPVTFSAGAAAPRPGETGREVLDRADRHCYIAKTAGRDQWILDDIDTPTGSRKAIADHPVPR